MQVLRKKIYITVRLITQYIYIIKREEDESYWVILVWDWLDQQIGEYP